MPFNPPKVINRLVLGLVSLTTLQLSASGLPDTGQTLCYDGSSMVSCTAGNTGDSSVYVGQDGRYGRDPAAIAGHSTKIGGGDAGFDYTKVCNSGELAGVGSCPSDPAFGANNDQWGCTKDNITGLIWELKTDDGGLRDKNWTYSWYSANARSDGTSGSLNAGYAGVVNGGACYMDTNCDTAGYVADINSVTLCGSNDWRVPKVDELRTIVHYGNNSPAIDTSYFPNTPVRLYWSASAFAPNNSLSWSVSSGNGRDVLEPKPLWHPVRLVRGPL